MAAGDLTTQLMLAGLAGNQATVDPTMAAALPRIQMAQAMMQNGLSTAPTTKWGALSQLGQALLGNYTFDKATSGLQDAYANSANDMANSLPANHPLITALKSTNPVTRAAAMKVFPAALTSMSGVEFARPGTTPMIGATAPQAGPFGGYSPTAQLGSDANNNPGSVASGVSAEQALANAKAIGALPATMTAEQYKTMLTEHEKNNGPVPMTPSGTLMGPGAGQPVPSPLPVPGISGGLPTSPPLSGFTTTAPPMAVDVHPTMPSGIPTNLNPLHVPGTPLGNAGPLNSPPVDASSLMGGVGEVPPLSAADGATVAGAPRVGSMGHMPPTGITPQVSAAMPPPAARAPGQVAGVSAIPPEPVMSENAKDFGALSKAATEARGEIAQAQLLQKDLNAMGATGPATPYLAKLSRYAAQAGVPENVINQFHLPDGATEAQAAANANMLAMEVAKAKFPGRVTNVDISLAKSTKPSTEMPLPASNFLINNSIIPNAQWNVDRFNSVANMGVQGDPSYSPGYAALHSQLNNFENSHPLTGYMPHLQTTPAAAAAAALRAHPSQAADYDARYGAGSAAQILGTK